MPEDRTKPRGRWITLAVLRAPARTANGTDDPTISIGAHGRYGSFEDMVKSPARDHSELISFATRVADTLDRSMACPEFEPVARALIGKPHDEPVTITAGKTALGQCYRRLSRHMDLSRYTYEDVAADVLDLIRALHLDHVNISTWGDYAISAYAIVRAAPAAVRTLTLEGPDAPGTSRVTDPTGELVAAMNQYYRLCAKDRACVRAYPDLAASLAADIRFANASPQVITYQPGQPDLPLRVYIDGAGDLKAVAFALERIDVTGVLASGISNPNSFNELDAPAVAAWPYPFYLRDFPWARLLSAWCSYDVDTRSETADVSSATYPAYAGIDDGMLQWQCAAWPVKKVSQSVFNSFATEIPTLIVEGALDPRVLPQWAATLQSGMPHSTVLTFSSRSDDIHDGAPVCLNDLRRQFLADPTKPLNTAGCDSQPIAFTPPIK